MLWPRGKGACGLSEFKYFSHCHPRMLPNISTRGHFSPPPLQSTLSLTTEWLFDMHIFTDLYMFSKLKLFNSVSFSNFNSSNLKIIIGCFPKLDLVVSNKNYIISQMFFFLDEYKLCRLTRYFKVN